MTSTRSYRTWASSTCLTAILFATPCALGQSAERAIFVSNDGDLDGGVTSFVVEPDGTLTFVDQLVTGMRGSVDDPCPGCHAHATALSPDGRFLAVGHASGDGPSHRLTILQVASDASLLQVGTFSVPSTPRDLVWLSNVHLAVTRSDSAAGSEVRTYQFNPSGPALILIDTEATGTFNSSLALDRERGYLYAQDSMGNSVQSFAAAGNGTLTPIQTLPTGDVSPVGLGLSPDGARLYAGGGASSGGDKVIGFDIEAATGLVSVLADAPYTSTGTTPNQVVLSGDGLNALVSCAGDSTVRVFGVDPITGTLAPTGSMFDAGTEGTLGRVAVLDDLVFVTSASTLEEQAGVYSHTLDIDGVLTPNGPLASTLAFAPLAIATWSPPPAPPCPADLDGSGGVGFGDILHLIGAWGACPECPEDLDGSGDVGFSDILIVVGQWGVCAG